MKRSIGGGRIVLKLTKTKVTQCIKLSAGISLRKMAKLSEIMQQLDE